MRSVIRPRWVLSPVLSVLSACFLAPAYADPRPAVVELFTSEGCSSCPPAEAYVGELAKRRDVLALAFHVDYWDDLGWRDRYGLSQAVERQNRYARTLHLSTVYTPEVVVDGQRDYVGSNRSGIGKALVGTRDGVSIAIDVSNGHIVIKLGARKMTQPSDVVLVAYLRKAVSSIGRGENAGRTLEEYNIVRAMRELGSWNGTAQDFRLERASLPQDASDVAVLIQAPGPGPVVGAATRALAP
jgi:hypothetical protein